MNILRTFLFLCGAIGFCLSEEDDAKYRLPIEVIPYSYAIKLQPFIPEGYFKGEVYIKIGVTSPVDAIYLHASNLNISEIKIVGELENILFKIEEKYELIKIYYENGEKILVGDQMLHFIYEGTLLHTDQMGMVKAMYPFKNETEVLVITDFQPTYARRAYPCFDEPAMKAIFNVTIITPNSSWVALSNAEEIVSTLSNIQIY
ncbi:hypothetical protein HHI36_008213 [Cryptolaemus montrouzieri]|uniref:Aminopeptidase N-like N-terminal domain-containing protein n=1 Tax=Cryptolaemus montrouzieri TaxID=559131 RepID=A0ABD2MS41_9CUCU